MTSSKKQKLAQADQAARLMVEALTMIQAETGFATDIVLAGAHSAIITKMVSHLGGPMTALACDQASQTVRHMPSLAACSQAYSGPVGRA